MNDRDRILNALADNPDGMYAFDLAKTAGVKVGHLYPILYSLETTGRVSSEWAEPAANGLRRRRYFRSAEGGDRTP